MTAHEVNFDGIVGPTHNYAGLSYGNVASQSHAGHPSNPKAAALEGLAKMKFLMDLGVKQAVLPPHERPDIRALRRLGFDAPSDEQVLALAYQEDPRRLADCCSASAMWAANAATVSASPDCSDGRMHITVANLKTMFHRSLEAETTRRVFRRIFTDEDRFAIHDASEAPDEGAANHMRLCIDHGSPGVEVFVFGDGENGHAGPSRYPARQSRDASLQIAESHQLRQSATMFVQQNPDMIDAGVFHNDVIAVGNQNVLLVHERAYVDQSRVIDSLRSKLQVVPDNPLTVIEITERELPVSEAVASYFFNSQLLTLDDASMAILYPIECQKSPAARDVIERILDDDNPLDSAHAIDVRQSMRNGGGPACLRLRVVMTEEEIEVAYGGVFLSPGLYENLVAWVNRHYRDHLVSKDLCDPKLLDESRAALDELTQILSLGSVYPFQAN